MHPVRTMFKSLPAPRPVKADLVYWPPLLDGTPEFWTVRIYRDDLRTMNAEDQQVIAHWVFDVIQKCREVTPRVYHEVLESEEVNG